jgi:hypothetical protein
MSIFTGTTDKVKLYVSTHWKRALYSLGAAGLSFGALEAIRGLISLTALTAVAAGAIGVMVYVKVADWEFKRAFDAVQKAKDTVQSKL